MVTHVRFHGNSVCVCNVVICTHLYHNLEVIRKRPPRSTSAMLAPSLQISSEDLCVQDSSELTHGLNQVLCGNPVRALRARQQRRLTSQV